MPNYLPGDAHDTFMRYRRLYVHVNRGRANTDKLRIIRQLRESIAAMAYQIANGCVIAFFRNRGTQLRGIDTEDCVQNAVMRVLEVAHKFNADRGRLYSFLTRVVQNSFISSIRHERVRSSRLTSLEVCA